MIHRDEGAEYSDDHACLYVCAEFIAELTCARIYVKLPQPLVAVALVVIALCLF